MSLVEQALAKLKATKVVEAAEAAAAVAEPQRIARRKLVSPLAGDEAPRVIPETGAAGAHLLVPSRYIEFNRSALREAGLMAPESAERAVADEYRHLKRPILQAADPMAESPRPFANLLFVGSAFSGEGKSFTCLNLCLSLAMEKDWSVLMIDADVLKPHLSRLMDIENEPGLIDVLKDSALEPETLVIGTDVPKLAVLPAGSRDAMATELLGSARMRKVAHALAAADPRRLVVFDSPPLLQTTEARQLAAIAGQVIVVVAAQQTPQPALFDALSMIDDAETRVRLVLNKVNRKRGPGYYYGYGHGYGSEPGGSST